MQTGLYSLKMSRFLKVKEKLRDCSILEDPQET